MTVSMTIAACFLALLFASTAVSSKSVLLEDHDHDHHQDFRPAHTVDSQSYHVEDSNGLSFTNSIVTPKRLKGTARKLAVISEAINEKKQMTEKKRNNVDNAVRNGGRPVKHEVNHKQKDSKKIKHPHPSSSGIQTSLSLDQENKFILKDQMPTRFTFQKKTRTLLASSTRTHGDNSKQDASPSKSKEAGKRDEASFQGAKTPSTPRESHNFSTSSSSTYQSNETDLSDLVDMDYGKVHRKPPIHNSFSP